MFDLRQIITPEEQDALLRRVRNRQNRLAIEFLFLTGIRQQELLILDLDDLRPDVGSHGALWLPWLKRKTDDPGRVKLCQRGLERGDEVARRVFPLGPRSRDVWDALADGRLVMPDVPLLVGNRSSGTGRLGVSTLAGAFRRAWKAARLRPGQKPPSLHATRHTFLTRKARERRGDGEVIPLHVLRDLAGHSTVKTTSLYLHAQLEELQQAMESQ